MSPMAYGLTSLSKMTRRSNHLQMLEQRKHLLLNYFKTLSVGPAGNRAQASRTVDWHLTNWANQVTVKNDTNRLAMRACGFWGTDLCREILRIVSIC